MLHDLANSLILGANAKATEALTADGPLGVALDQLANRDDIERILAASALLAPYETAGMMIADSATIPTLEICPPETNPLCQPEAAVVLDEILTNQVDLVDEWLRVALAKGLLAPPHLLPKLLDIGRKSKARQVAIMQVAGKRGAWLASINSAWKFAAAAGTDMDDDTVWEEGGEEARVAWITARRESDPATALRLITEALPNESAALRTRFLNALSTGLSLVDEPIAEASLDDRSKNARAAAADLLAALPESAFAARMTARMEALVTAAAPPPDKKGIAAKLAKRLLGGKDQKLSLTIEPPPEFDEAALRDGLTELTGKGKLGHGGHRLNQLAAATPLTFWERFGDPDHVLSAIVDTDWAEAILRGLAIATLTQKNLRWAKVLISFRHKRIDLPRWEFIQLFAPEQRSALLMDELNSSRGDERRKAIVEIANTQPGPWEPDLSLLILRLFREELKKSTNHWQFHHCLTTMAPLLAADVLQQAEQEWPLDHGCGPAFDERLTEFSQIIRLRTRLHKGFSP